MSDADRKARQLISQARVKLSSRKSFFSWLFQTKWSKIEEAIELFQKACNLLRIAKKWGEVGDVLCEIAVLHEEIGTKHDVACDYVSAASCFKKIDRIKAIECLGKAAEVYTDIGRFVLAAKQLQGIAELYEVEELDLRKAIDHYEQAADYFKGEENNLSADKCLLKVGGARWRCRCSDEPRKKIALNFSKNSLIFSGGKIRSPVRKLRKIDTNLRGHRNQHIKKRPDEVHSKGQFLPRPFVPPLRGRLERQIRSGQI